MQAAEIIKSAVTMHDVIDKYGFKTNRAGFMPCPFHGDKTASLKVYPGDRGWHCFGCHEGGDVISFIKKLFGLDFVGAIKRIDADFNLNISDDKPDFKAVERLKAERAAREKLIADYRAAYDLKCREFRRYSDIIQDKAPSYMGEPFHPEYVEAVQALPLIEYWFELNGWR